MFIHDFGRYISLIKKRDDVSLKKEGFERGETELYIFCFIYQGRTPMVKGGFLW